MKKLLFTCIVIGVVIGLAACAGETPESEYRTVIEDMTANFEGVAEDAAAADSVEEAAEVLNSYAESVPGINSRFMALSEKYPDTDVEGFQENEAFAEAIQKLEDANLQMIEMISELENRYGSDETLQNAVWGYIQALSMTAEDAAEELEAEIDGATDGETDAETDDANADE